MWLLDRPIAHRGLHGGKVTENSMEAFKKAIEKNYYIETDVRLLADGEVVVFHDSSLKRITGQNVKISKLTTEDIKGDKYLLPNGEHIPLFREFVELIEGKTKLLLELKTITLFNNKLEEKVYEIIKGKEDFIAVQSFSPFIIKWFRQNAPEMTRGFLSTYIGNSFCNMLIDKMNNKVIKNSKPEFLAFNIKNLPNPKINKLREENNLKLLSWTVKSDDNLKTAKEVNVDNIIFESMTLENESY